jgi:hypothetical protein
MSLGSVLDWMPGGGVNWLAPWENRTPWREYREGGMRYRIRAEYGMHKIGDQEPYFAITGETRALHRTRWVDDSAGAIHDEIAKHIPKLAPFIKWHLVSYKGGPMHYLANAGYWWDIASGRHQVAESERGRVDPVRAFMNTIVFGALENDEMPPLETPTEAVLEWLRWRQPALRSAFKEAMMEASRLEIHT